MIREAVKSFGAGDPAEYDKLMKQLADYLGMKGGIYRRMGKIGEALEAYLEGYEIEKTYASAPYNLSNVIALSIVRDPSCLAKWQSEIEARIDVLSGDEALLGKWWTHADLGMFYLLSGHLDSALKHYNTFKMIGADFEAHQTTIDVLRLLRDSLQSHRSSIAPQISEAISALLEQQHSL